MEWWGVVEGISVVLVVVGAVSVLVAIGLARMAGTPRDAATAAPGEGVDDPGADEASRALLARAIAHARGSGRPMAILCVDLDDAKRASEALDPAARVALLETLAGRLRAYVRAGDRVTRHGGDTATAGSRLGGDEFVLLLGDMTARQDATGVARRILEEFSRPLMAGGQSVSIAASAGIAVYPGDGDDADTLLAHARLALRHAQGQGRGTYALYCDAACAEALEGLGLKTELDRAIEGHEARLFGEPRAEEWRRAGASADAPARP